MTTSTLHISRFFNVITLILSLFVLTTLSYEIIHLGNYTMSNFFIRFQLFVCLIFLIDFALRLSLSHNKQRFLLYNFALLIVSIPVLNILDWINFTPNPQWYVIYRLMPLIRGIYGLVIVVSWITRSGIISLLVSYITSVLVFTYSASLLFYSLEKHLNPSLNNFGDALWWSWMNLTTVGANIFAKTAIGKTLTVMLSSLGMMMFPIFTAFVINKFDKPIREKPMQKKE